VLTGAPGQHAQTGGVGVDRWANKPVDDAWERQRGDSHDPPFHTSGKKAQSARGVIRRQRVLAGAYSIHSKGRFGRPLTGNRLTGRYCWLGLTGLSMAVVSLATKSWMMVGHSHTGKNRAAMHERGGNGRRVPKAPSVRKPGPARHVDAGGRRKAFAGGDVDGPGRESGIAAATWQTAAMTLPRRK
jgi:hypothetical protein